MKKLLLGFCAFSYDLFPYFVEQEIGTRAFALSYTVGPFYFESCHITQAGLNIIDVGRHASLYELVF